MEARFEGIDFDADAKVADEMKTVIRTSTEGILGSSLSKEQLEVLTLCLSRRYAGNMKNISLEVMETFGEDVDEMRIQKLLQWIERDLPRTYGSVRGQKSQQNSDSVLEKREKPASVLERVVTRGETPLPTAPAEAATGKQKRDPSRTRCVHWPSCKNAECHFAHPKENVISKVSEVPLMPLRQQVSVHPPGSKYRS